MRRFLIATALVAAPALAQTAPSPTPPLAPSAEAEALGRHIAERGTLAALLPLATARDTDDLVARHPELDAAARDRLRAAAAATVRAATDRLMSAVGHQYALRLSLPDLKALAAFSDGPAAAAWRAAEPQVIAASIAGIDGFDLKREAWAAYCRDPAATCAAAK